MKTTTWIKRYAEKHTTPDQNYCPIFGIEWKGHNKELGNYYKIYVPYNGKLCVNEVPVEVGKSNNRWTRRTYSPRNYAFIGSYIKYIGHDVLEVAYVIMDDGSRGKEGERREWRYEPLFNQESRIFIDRETLMPYNAKGERIWQNDDGKFYNRTLVKALNSLANYGRMTPSQVLKETLNEFCNVDNLYGGYRNSCYCDMSQVWHLAEFIQKAKERPKSKLAVSLASYNLPERYYTETTVEFYPIDDEYAVFRIFKANTSWSSYERKYVSDGNPANEYARVFIRNDGKVSVMEKQIDNSWNIIGKKLSSIAYIYDDTVNKFDGMYEWKPIKWNMDIIKGAYDINGRNVVSYIINLLRHPVIEKLYKMGYKNIATHLAKNEEVIARIKDIFYINDVKEKEKNIYKMLGMNKYELQKLEDCFLDSHTINATYKYLADIKEIFGTPDISSLSKETIDMYITGLKACGYRGWGPLIGDHSYYYRPKRFTRSATEEQKRLLEKLFRLEQTERGIIEAYSDARVIYNRLRIKPEIDWTDFRHLEDVNILHDNLQGLMNTQEEEYRYHRTEMEKKEAEEREKKFKKLQEDRVEKFECVGEKYSIVTPKNLTEITTEGSSLHHCVGGYLNNHAEGRTNILFLRNNELPNTPFYTIEVTPDDYVVQIHGRNNRWLGNDPDAISFVWKWIKDRGFRCEKYKLLNTGAGYSKGGNEVSESYLTA